MVKKDFETMCLYQNNERLRLKGGFTKQRKDNDSIMIIDYP